MITSAHFTVLSEPGGSTPNDDRAGGQFGHETGHAWVIDGATGVAPEAYIPGADSDAAWLAGQLDRYFTSLPMSAAPVRVPMRRIVGRIRDDYFLAVAGRDVPDFAIPSAAALYCGWERCAHKLILRLSGLGDCIALLRDGEGQIHIVGDVSPGSGDAEKLAGFDAFHGATDAASQAALGDFLKQQRRQMNRPGGYWVFSISPEAAGYLREHTFVLIPPVDIMLMTDGFSRLIDHFEAYTPESLLRAADHKGVEYLYRELRELEAGDIDRRKAPRVKVEDDASVVFFQIAPGRTGRR